MSQQPPPSPLSPPPPLPPLGPPPPRCQDLFALCLPRCLLAAAPHGQEHPSPHLLSIDSIYPRSGCSRRASPASHGKTRLSMGRLCSYRLGPLPSPSSKFFNGPAQPDRWLEGAEGHRPLQHGEPRPITPTALGQTGVHYPRGSQAGSSPSAFGEAQAVALGSTGPRFRGFFLPKPPHAHALLFLWACQGPQTCPSEPSRARGGGQDGPAAQDVGGCSSPSRWHCMSSLTKSF